MFCAISGEPPQEPVVNKKSGLIYEKRLILKYIQENGKDPMSGEELTEDDLLDLKTNPRTVQPRPPTLSSVPALLAALQNEWDSVMLETFALKQQYNATRQELSHALYQQDAAERVVARLMRERDQAREALANIQATLGGAPAAAAAPNQDVEMAEEGAAGALPSAVVGKIEETAKILSAARKGRSKKKPAADYPAPADVKAFTQKAVVPSMHSTKPPGITALDLDNTGNLALTGGNDKQVQVFDRAQDKTLATLKGHTKKITRVAFVDAFVDPSAEAPATSAPPKLALSASADKTVKVWRHQEEGKQAYALATTFSVHKQDVTGLSVHPTRTFAGSASLDATWAFHDLDAGKTIVSVDAPSASEESAEDAAGGYEYTSFSFHPDGVLAGAGTSGGAVRIWDVKSAKKVISFGGHVGAVNDMSFSENGYYLATSCSGEPVVRIWDLRKLSVISQIAVGGSAEQHKVETVRFDRQAQFLAVGGTDVRVYQNKSWEELWSFDGNSADVTGVAWTPAGEMVVSGLDRTLRVLGKAE